MNIKEQLDDRTARHFVESLALACQGANLFQSAPEAVARGFVTSRLRQERGRTFGAFARGANIDTDALIERALPTT